MPQSSAFQGYVPRIVRYWDHDVPGQRHNRVDGTLVFVDISGFTSMSERLARHGNVGAEEVTDVINHTFAGLLPEGYRHGSHLLKFGGDAMLLMFVDPGHTERAMAAAHDMRAKLREVGTFQTTAGKVFLRMSIGAHSGLIDFFLVGSSHRELIVAGPTATRTVEMEAAAEAGQIMISPETAAVLPYRVVGEATGPGYLLRQTPETADLPFRQAKSPDVDLAQFIPSALRTTLVEEVVEPEHRPASVAFIHFEGLDALLENRGGEQAASVLDDLVCTVQEAADTQGVTFLGTDIAGDGAKIILTAGVPETTGNDNERMLLALRQIVDRDSSGQPIRIGVNWGPVFAGEVGPPYRRSYTVMGDAVNLAARLMAKAPQGEIYTVQSVLDDSRTVFATSTPPPFTVKGKQDQIQAYSVGHPEGTREKGSDLELALVGRESELERMLEAWSRTTDGLGRAIEVVAEAGMGKTRLVEEFVARTGHARLIRSECRLYQATTPYFPLRAVLAQVCGFDSDNSDEHSQTLNDIVKRRAPHLEPWLALIGEVAGLDLEKSPEVAYLEDQYRPARTLSAVGSLLESVVTEPTMFIIRNGHWMDPSSRELLAGLIALMERQPWLFVISGRPTGGDSLVGEHPWSEEIELGPLTKEASRKLIIEASADAPLLPDQVEALASRAEGRPMFLLELLQALRRGGDVDELPSSVEGLVGARIDQLPRTDRHLLRRLAVLGAGFHLDYTGSVLSESELDRRWQLAAIRRLHDFLTTDDGRWIQFRNALIRDVAYEGLPFKTRIELHARVGESIRAAAGNSPDTQAALLSLHFFQARRWPDAWHYSLLAGDNAKAVYSNQTAATFYRRALVSAKHVDLTIDERASVAEALGDVLEQAGMLDEAIDAYKRARAVVGDNPVRRADILLKRAQAKMRKGEFAQALRDSATGLRLIDNDGTHEARVRKAKLMALRSTVRLNQQQPRAALALANKAAAEARSVGEDDALARALATMDWANFVTGQPDKATNSEHAAEIYESLGLLDKAADVINNMGGFAYYLGNWKESLARYQQAKDMYLKAGNDWSAAMVGGNMGELLVSQGRLDEAEPILDEAVRILSAAHARKELVFAELQLARLVAERGDHNRAFEMLTKVRDAALEVGQNQDAFEATLYRAQCHTLRGNTEEALAEIDEAAEKAGDDAIVLTAKRARITAAALLASGRVKEACAQISAGLASAQEFGLIYDEALLRIDQLSVNSKLGHQPDPIETEKTNRLLGQLGLELAVISV